VSWAQANIALPYTPFYGSGLNRLTSRISLRHEREQASPVRRSIPLRDRHVPDLRLCEVTSPPTIRERKGCLTQH
jgi:hypothetical protein